MADSDVGKLFVGGISKETTETTLRDHFSKYGVVSSSIIAKDRVTCTPRGFGFVSFFDPCSVDKALQDHHFISGRTVEVKRAIPRNEQQTNSQDLGRKNSNVSYGSNNGEQFIRTKKIFVGGLSANLTEEEFKAYFERFGRITDVVVMHDNNTNRPRGFGFITFDSEDVVENIMQKTHHELAGKRVEVKRAVPRDATKNHLNRFSPFKEESYGGRGVRYGGSYNPNQGQGQGQGQGHVGVGLSYPGFYYNGGVYGGGYPVGGYGFYGYGMPVVPPQSACAWNGFGMMGVRPVAYGTGYYPSNVNGGVAMMGMVNPYNTIMENQNGATTGNGMNGARSDVDGSSFKSVKGGGGGVVNGNKNSQAKVGAPMSQSS